jgi:hypothetical protein
MTPDQKSKGVALWQAEARRLHTLADQWLLDCQLEDAADARRRAIRAEHFASKFRTTTTIAVPSAISPQSSKRETAP